MKEQPARAKRTDPSKTPDPLLTVDDLCAYLQVSRRTLYRWASEKKGPQALKISGMLRYRLADVETWLEAQNHDAPAAHRVPATGPEGAHMTDDEFWRSL